MAATTSRMTKEQLRDVVGELVEEKLLELLGDPDEGLTVREALRKRLLRQKKAVARGERGLPLAEVARRLGLA